MLKSKISMFTITFLIFVISFGFMQNNYAKFFDNEVTDWKVMITCDTKDLRDTQEIIFKVEDNNNVVNGKLAPGLKATASVKIDLSKAIGDVEIEAFIDDTTLENVFQLTSKLNGEVYQLGETKIICEKRESQIQELELILEWTGNNDETDTRIGTMMNCIKVPITISVSQHI